jgi:hypothetical protein
MKPIKFFAVALVLFCGCSVGCTPADVDQLAQIGIAPIQPVAEIPGANLPVEMRPKNWTDAGGSGSCVNASTVHNLRWANQPALADYWRRTYAGGETDTSIRRAHDANALPYYFTRSADMSFLQWVTDTRRSALVWYYPSHCINFSGFHRDPSKPTDPTVYAWLCDNNRPSRFIRVPADTFAQKWAGYGGFGLALAAPPVPPPLFPATYSRVQ